MNNSKHSKKHSKCLVYTYWQNGFNLNGALHARLDTGNINGGCHKWILLMDIVINVSNLQITNAFIL